MTMQRLILSLQLIVLVLVGIENESGPVRFRRIAAKPAQKEGLYSSKDDVAILNNANFKNRVYGKNTIWVIEFYNSWCGHCINFAPTWKRFASDLKGWRRVVSIGAVDCANDENLSICRDFDIGAYPSMKILPPNFSDKVTKSTLHGVNSQEDIQMKKILLEFLITGDFPHPTSWPRLNPLKSLGDIWEEATEEHKFVVVVFEDEDSIVGKEVILDVVDYPSILVRTMLKKDVEKFGIIKYPSLYIINKDSSFQHLVSGTGLVEKDRQAFVDKLMSLMGLVDHEGNSIKILDHHLDSNTGGDHGSVVQFEKPKVEQQVEGPGVALKPARTQVHMQDLESALHYTFRQEIAICKTIEGPKFDALRNFISILAKYFPGRPQVSRFLWKLVNYLGNRDTTKGLTGDTWVTMIDKLQDADAFLPERVLWVSCEGSQPRYRGYPCGMWTLFHTLTVAAYQSTAVVNAQEVPLAIRGYMEHFFGCHECVQNFLKMAKSMEKEIHRPVEGVLWLWKAHNKANRRLHGDITEDPQHPKIQFPSMEDCRTCHISEESLARSQSPDGWNTSAVALFLIEVYGKDSIVQDVSSKFGGEGGGEKLQHGEVRAEMDWWEKKQRQADLKKIRELREQKKRRKEVKLRQGLATLGLDKVEAVDVRRRRGQADEVNAKVKEQSVEKVEVLSHEGWGFSHLDIGVCMVFYVCCAIIILVLYYHFVVHKRQRLPCSNFFSLW